MGSKRQAEIHDTVGHGPRLLRCHATGISPLQPSERAVRARRMRGVELTEDRKSVV